MAINFQTLNPFGMPIITAKEQMFDPMAAYMQGIKALHAPDMAQYENMIKGTEAEFSRPKAEQNIRKTEADIMAQILKNKIEEETGMKAANADIAYKQAQTKYAGGQKPEAQRLAELLHKPGTPEYKQFVQDYAKSGTGRSNLTPGMRAWSSMPSNVRNDMIAQGAGWGVSPEEVIAFISSGGTMDQLKEIKKAQGVDVESAEKVYSPTTSNITKIKDAAGAASELDYLEQATASDLSQYGATFNGYSPKQIIDSLKGTDEEAMIRFLGARALQPEIAGARSRVAGGSNAHEALKDAKEAALANFKVFGPLITPRIREGVQRYINDKLKGGFEARKRGVLDYKNTQKEFGEFLKQSKKENGQMFRVRNKETGKEETITREEAIKEGLIKS